MIITNLSSCVLCVYYQSSCLVFKTFSWFIYTHTASLLIINSIEKKWKKVKPVLLIKIG